MSPEDIERILEMGLFSNMDATRFSSASPLNEIIRNDTKLIRFNEGEIAVRAGDFGNSAFLILSGAVGVIHPPGLPEELLGRQRRVHKKSTWSALSQLWRNAPYPEVRKTHQIKAVPGTQIQGKGDDTRFLLKDPSSIAEQYETTVLVAGEIFGEIAALARIPRSATIFAMNQVEALEIRWQALSEFRRRIPEFRAHLDTLYRERSLNNHLVKGLPLLEYVNDEVIQKIADVTLFESYGEFDWHIDFNRLQRDETKTLIDNEPLLANEGDYADGLILIRAGFGRVSKKKNFGHQTLNYLRSGDVFGLDEILDSYHEKQAKTLQTSIRAVGYLNVLRVPTVTFEKLVLSNMPDSVVAEWRAKQPQQFNIDIDPPAKRIETGALEFLVDGRFINGSATMLIDLDRCVRCDECVKACAQGHNNNPRFNRHGQRHNNIMIANACMHCVDPVCMIGCPTGAIHRAATGEVVINDKTCIGCATCANSCPYENIRMVEARHPDGSFIVDDETNHPIVKATKCDLCIDQTGGPACQRACPHDALTRMEMQDRSKLASWLNRS